MRTRSEGDAKEMRRRSEGDPKEIRRRCEGDHTLVVKWTLPGGCPALAGRVAQVPLEYRNNSLVAHPGTPRTFGMPGTTADEDDRTDCANGSH
ncbi:MAG TPA: hypothetical protein VF145_08250 [Chitinophagaceae bacterium]